MNGKNVNYNVVFGVKNQDIEAFIKREVKGNDDVLMSPTSVIEDDTSGKKEYVFLWANTFIFCAEIFLLYYFVSTKSM
jgi:hypothetical protein